MLLPFSDFAQLQFSEKLSHSTVPWSSQDRERRSVFYKFVPFGQHHADKRYDWEDPRLTAAQRERLTLPDFWYNDEERRPCEPYARL